VEGLKNPHELVKDICVDLLCAHGARELLERIVSMLTGLIRL
jgi:hypothetical protein